MKYEALVNDAKMYKGFLPAYLCEMTSKQKVVLYGGFDDSSDTNLLVSLAVFSLSSQHKDETRLEYIFVAKEKRAQGYAGELLSFCTKKMKSAGIRMVNCKLCDEEISLEMLLRKENYIPVSFTGHFLEYTLHDFLESKVFGRIETGQKAGVLTVGKCDEKMMKRFFALADSDKCYMDKNHIDEEYSRFLEKSR